MRKLLFALFVLAASPALAEDNLKLSANDISVRTVLSSITSVPNYARAVFLPAM